MASTTIVAIDELRAHLDDSAWLVIDCRHTLADFSLGRRLYGESHIPGAFFADIESDLSGTKTGTNGRHPLPDPDTFAEFLRSLGANDDTQLIAYDAGADMPASRLWFLSRWIGHDRVAILDGGFAAWTAARYETTAALPAPRARGTLTVSLHSEYVVDAPFVHTHLESPDMQLVDGRASDRFAGQNETVDPVAGHIPGAANRWFKSNFDERGLLKSAPALHDELSALARDPRTIVHQCGSGVSAAMNMLAMEHAGLHGSRLYGGSWSEWIADPKRPREPKT